MRCVLISFALAVCAFGQTAGVTAELGKTVVYAGIDISPDGKRLAWTQTVSSQQQPKLWAGTVGGAFAPVALPGVHKESDPVWSPDSQTLAFFSTAAGQAQLWTWSPGTLPRKRTRLTGHASHPRWSPDGKKIAFLHVEGASGGGPLEAAAAQVGVIEQEIRNQRIAVIELASGKVTMASPARLNIYDFDWAPNSADFVTTAAPGPGDNNWWIAELYVIRDGEARSIHKTPWQIAVPRWSPDGTKVAFIEGLMSDEGFHGGNLMVIPAKGGAAENLTTNRPTSPSAAVWLDDQRLLITEASKGGSAAAEVSLATGEIRTLWEGPEDLHAFGHYSNFSLSRDGRVSAAIRGNFNSPPEVAVGPAGAWQPVTKNNAARRAEWGAAESIKAAFSASSELSDVADAGSDAAHVNVSLEKAANRHDLSNPVNNQDILNSKRKNFSKQSGRRQRSLTKKYGAAVDNSAKSAALHAGAHLAKSVNILAAANDIYQDAQGCWNK